MVLIHGFGASVYHWRYNIPALAKNHRVFAMDMLGFGWSEKPVLEYSGCAIWANQLQDFIKEVRDRSNSFQKATGCFIRWPLSELCSGSLKTQFMVSRKDRSEPVGQCLSRALYRKSWRCKHFIVILQPSNVMAASPI